ncbi:MAG: TetR/AcrR family transcriptional regulator [Erysipelotrichaceae bacterium]|nr:TetR/AcrR family transcriptional regulator [Erysipelotrichaceae bacterium]
MRVVKEGKERRKEILDVSERLFCVNGYDNTSTNDILAEIGIARGTLYYHFKSKEDILDGIIERIIDGIERKVAAVALNEKMPVLERFTKVVLSANVDNEVGNMILEQVHKPQNALMHQKMEESLLNAIAPYFVKVIKDGIKEGIMKSDYPEEVIEMTLSYANKTFDDTIDYPEDLKLKKVQAFIRNSELLLQMKEGSLYEAMMPMFYRK